MEHLRLFIAVISVALPLAWADAATPDTSQPHPWCPPFGLARVGQSPTGSMFEADAEPDVEPITNPVDLGAILIPHGWFLIGPTQTAFLDIAAISQAHNEPQARLRAWYASEPTNAVSIPFSLSAGEREQTRIRLPAAPPKIDRDIVHVTLERPNGDVFWKKTIPAMIVHEPPRWPRFGAMATKLRYDAPISVRNVDGTYSALDYAKEWDPHLQDVVVSLPNGTRFVFWRGSSYVPFWAGRRNTGFCYEWAETTPPADGFTDSVEPLMDKELRYGRVEIVKSTAARIHVRWSYQSCDFNYKVWGDSAVEDFYFYPDGFGTRVLTLKSTPNSNYELNEFIILTPQDAYPLDVLPENLVEILFFDRKKREITFPYNAAIQGVKMKSRDLPAIYRVKLHKDDPMTAIYFHAQDRRLPPVVYRPFTDAGRIVTRCYWGSHWPLARGQSTGRGINDRIHTSPAHNSVMTWAMQRPPTLRAARLQTLDALGRAKLMDIQSWFWLIGLTDETDSYLLEFAQSFASPPSIEALTGARLETESFSPERRALRLLADSSIISMELRPTGICVNPVFEIRNVSPRLAHINVDGSPLPCERYAWDGKTLWISATLRKPSNMRIAFGD
jgi:hypothetical protein